MRQKYTGKDYDEDIGLYYFNARWYDAGVGRFITEDPIRFGGNWYNYAAANPLMYVDPTGLYDWYDPYGTGNNNPSYEYEDSDGELVNSENNDNIIDWGTRDFNASAFHDPTRDSYEVTEHDIVSNETLRNVYYLNLTILDGYYGVNENGDLVQLTESEAWWILNASREGWVNNRSGRLIGNGIGYPKNKMDDRNLSVGITWVTDLEQPEALIWPTPGIITTTFNDPEYDPFNKGIVKDHPSLDIANPIPRTRVFAPHSGTITQIYDDLDSSEGYGVEITGADGRKSSLYHFAERPFWNLNDQVEIGMQIGFMGNTGRSTGPHLHWNNKINGSSTDPMTILGAVQKLGGVSP